MPLFGLNGKNPKIAEGAFVAATATVVGDVVLEPEASVWYGAVVRGDYGSVVIGRRSNVQDCSVIHTSPRHRTEIGSDVTIGHGCVVHAAVLEDGCLIGNGAVVLDGATVGRGSVVAAQSLVAPGAVIPPGVLAMGIPAAPVRELAGTDGEELPGLTAASYVELARAHGVEIEPLEG